MKIKNVVIGTVDFNDNSIPIDISNRFYLDSGEAIEGVDINTGNGMVLTSENRVYSWGGNFNGEVGDGTTTQRNTPLEITGNFTLGAGENFANIVHNEDKKNLNDYIKLPLKDRLLFYHYLGR